MVIETPEAVGQMDNYQLNQPSFQMFTKLHKFQTIFLDW